MRARIVVSLVIVLLCAASAAAQMEQTITLISDYYAHPGGEEDFMNLIRTVGAPVRDKLMAEGVILGWGVDLPVMRIPGMPSHSIWITVANWDGIEKYQAAMAAQLQRLAAEEQKAGDEARRRNQRPGPTTAERLQQAVDMSKTRDWVFRDLVSGYSQAPPPANILPVTRINVRKVVSGRGAEYRDLWVKYNKPVFDKLVADGVIWAYGLGVEVVPTTDEFSHFIWFSGPSLEAINAKVGAAFAADRGRRSPEERTQIAESFDGVLDNAASRSFLLRAAIFKIAPPPPR